MRNLKMKIFVVCSIYCLNSVYYICCLPLIFLFWMNDFNVLALIIAVNVNLNVNVLEEIVLIDLRVIALFRY
jgi:hypothetical protein